MLDPVAQSRELIRIISHDTKLPRHVRREADSLQARAVTKPALVLEHLEHLRQEVVPSLDPSRPT